MDFIINIVVIFFVILFWKKFILNKNVDTVSTGSSDGLTNNSWGKILGQDSSVDNERKVNRKKAIMKAQMFLKPYKELMGEHCLANENCKVNLIIEKNGEKKIVCIDKYISNSERRILTATISQEHINYYVLPLDYVIDNMWDNMCLNFATTTVYDNVADALRVGMLDVNEVKLDANTNASTQQVGENLKIRLNNLLNINTATEAELTALPGVNVVMAKKIIKHIMKNGDFKSLDEFIKTMHIKEVFSEQIKKIACVLPTVTSDTLSQPKTNTNAQNQDSTLDVVSNNNEQSSYIPHSDNERIIDL